MACWGGVFLGVGRGKTTAGNIIILLWFIMACWGGGTFGVGRGETTAGAVVSFLTTSIELYIGCVR